MNIFEKVFDFCVKNNISARISNGYKNTSKFITIYTCKNEYYMITLHHTDDWDREYNKTHRTKITQQTFGIEIYKPNGDAYQGSYGRNLSYNTLIKELKIEFLGVD